GRRKSRARGSSHAWPKRSGWMSPSRRGTLANSATNHSSARRARENAVKLKQPPIATFSRSFAMATVAEKKTEKKLPRPQIRQTQCFIDGQWVPAASGKTFDTIDPATEEVIASVAEGDAKAVDAAAR